MSPQKTSLATLKQKTKNQKKIQTLVKTRLEISNMPFVANKEVLLEKLDNDIADLTGVGTINWTPQGKKDKAMKVRVPKRKIVEPVPELNLEAELLQKDYLRYKKILEKIKKNTKLTDEDVAILEANFNYRIDKDALVLETPNYVPQMFGVGEAVAGLSESLRNVSLKIDNETIQSFADALKNVNIKHEIPEIKTKNDIGENLYDIAHRLLNRTMSPININHTNVILEALKSLKPIWPLLAVTIGVYLYKTDKVSLETLLTFVAVFGLLYFPTCVEMMRSLFLRLARVFEPQSNFDICEAFFSLFTVYNFGKDFSTDTLIKKFSLHLRDYDRVKVGAASWMNDAINLIQKIVNFFRVKVFGKDEWIFYLGNNDTLTQYLIECNSLLVQKEENPSISHEDGLEIQSLYQRGLEMQRIMSEPLDRQKLSFALSQLTPLRNKMRGGQWEGAGARIPPTVICIAGDSQIGKSSMVMSLVYRILAEYLTGERLSRFIENPDKEIFSYNWDREHQDGAQKQTVYLFDDAGCTTDVAGEKNNMYQTIIRITNIVPMHLNMAALELKSDSLFKGEFVVLTTNRDTWSLNSLHYIPAFVKRLHLCYNATCEPGMVMPTDVDPSFAFDFIRFQKMSYCHEGVQPPTFGEVIGGYEDLVRTILEYRWKQVRIGTDLMEAAKLQIAQGLIAQDDKVRYEKYFNQATTRLRKSSRQRELDVYSLRHLLDKLYYAKKKSKSVDEFHSQILSVLQEEFFLDSSFIKTMNKLYDEVESKLNIRYRCIRYLFPLDLENLIMMEKKSKTENVDDVRDPDEITVISQSTEYAECPSAWEPQILLDVNAANPDIDAPGPMDFLVAFIPVVGFYDYAFGMLAPVRNYIARKLRYAVPNMISLPESYKGSLAGWTNWSAWLSSRNCCDCALCSLKTFNCPASYDVLVENSLKNSLSGSQLLHRIYVQTLGALYMDRPEDRDHKQILIGLLTEAGCDAQSIFNANLAVTRDHIEALERFINAIPNDARVPHLCLNNPRLLTYLVDRPGYGLHLIAYIRIMKEMRLLREYGKKSFKMKLIKNHCSAVAKKIQNFKLWVNTHSQSIANISVWSSLLLLLIGPTLSRAIRKNNINRTLMVQSALFTCKNVTHEIKNNTCSLCISCHKCGKKFEFVFNIGGNFLVKPKVGKSGLMFIDSCRTMKVTIDNNPIDSNIPLKDFDVSFEQGMTIAIPAAFNSKDELCHLCCNSDNPIENLLKVTSPDPEVLMSGETEIVKMKPANWIPQVPCYDKVEHQIGEKIVLGNSLILHNVLTFEGETPTEEDYTHALSEKKCSILMLGDRIGLLPNHVYSYIKKNLDNGKISKKNPLILTYANDPQKLPIFWVPNDDQFYCLQGMEDKDLAIVRLPSMILKNYTHLAKYFISKKEVQSKAIYNGSLWTPKGGNSFQVRHAQITDTGFGSVDYLGYENGINWKYKIATIGGDCGSILTISNPTSGARKVAGIHVVGDTKLLIGSAIQIFREDVETIFNYFKKDSTPLQNSDFLDNFEPQFKCDNKYHTPYRKSPYPKPPRFKSKIVPSKLHHVGVVDRVPADPSIRVVDGAVIKPYTLAMSKSVTPHVLLDHEFLKVLGNYYTWFLSRRSADLPDTSYKLTTQELISGKEDDLYIRPINRKASLGPPYKWKLTKKDPTLKGKQEAFGSDEYLYDTPLAKEILEEFDRVQSLAEEGYRVIQLFEDSEKDEVLPVEKVKKGKIRIFSVGGFIVYLQEKENFAQFSSWFMQNRIFNESGIGMNVFGDDWHRMIMYLSFGSYSSASKKMFKALDISKFDGSQDRPVQYTWVTIKCSFFPPEERARRLCTAENYLNSFHIDHGAIMERDGSNSSGRSGTGEDNTGVLGLDLAYASVVLYQEILTGELSPIISLTSHQVYAFLEEYHTNNRNCKYGDDIIMSTKPTWRYFNEYAEHNYIRAFKVIGLTATSDAKGDEEFTYRCLEDVSFLKRTPKFSKRHLRYVGCLAIQSIMKSVQWLKRKTLPMDEYFAVLDKALQELSLHESEESQKLINDIIIEGRKIGYTPIATDIGILQDLCLSRDDYV